MAEWGLTIDIRVVLNFVGMLIKLIITSFKYGNGKNVHNMQIV